ncbi:pectinesterase inhibitor-like [Magnolia sinica]|uniref:pectinesterase inhibitor-like n=1 Tax=Magnolia sinica TaxID=86752 RepID=UPI0026582C17|nr:pectinesterase inhibitor-like [Magnolia sinica]
MSTFPLKLFLLLVVSQSSTATFSSSSNPSIHVINQPHTPKGVAGKDTTLIQETCKRTKSYDLCVKTLESDTRSYNTDAAGLTKIAIEHALTNANELYKQSILWRKKTDLDQKTIRALETCSQLYGDAIDGLTKAVQAMESKDYQTANLHVGVAKEAATTCNQEFQEYRRKMPFVEQNENLNYLSSIALALISHP